MSKLKQIKVLGCKGTGSDIAEAFLTIAGIPFVHVELDYTKAKDLRTLQKYNVLGQVPTLVLPNGEILTETLAIAAYANSFSKNSVLIPKDPRDQVKFWRWAVFLVTAIYPTFTYGDDPQKWVSLKKGAEQLRDTTDKWREKLWLEVERNCCEPYFLGQQFSAIDVYLSIMTSWRPRKEWFKANCPKVDSISSKALPIAISPRIT